jgi:hypothetical protein
LPSSTRDSTRRSTKPKARPCSIQEHEIVSGGEAFQTGLANPGCVPIHIRNGKSGIKGFVFSNINQFISSIILRINRLSSHARLEAFVIQIKLNFI